ncbi:hypothetical protein GDO81_027070 [Engystomops pustulosus]|uniref:KRAB domain-containing protein n=1 Tax=Engystomops pustulosus TaxID=76066 RepID=A0AAV6YMD0_ENGPU|nr:hypothetical protein GDO81_027070 [Engystomops pustulosus]
MTGEDYATIKKKFDKFVAPSIIPNLSGGWERRQSPIMEPYSQVPEKNMEQKILELTHKILELLSGEVPIRCQDVSVYFSMEEWDYIEGHKDLYKDIMMEEHQDPPSPDGSNDTGSPQRWESPLNLQDCSEEDHCELQDDEVDRVWVTAMPMAAHFHHMIGFEALVIYGSIHS